MMLTIAIFAALSILSVSCIIHPKTALDEIQNLRVEDVSSDSALILWDSVENATQYQIIVKNISSENFQKFFYTSETSFQAQGLEWAESYEISVNARPSDSDFFRYTEGPDTSITFKTKTPLVPAGELSRPENLKALVKNGTVTLSWGSVEAAAFYDIQREYWKDESHFFMDGIENIKCIKASETTYTDVLPEGTIRVFYKVCARNSNFSNTCYWSEKLYLKF